MIKAYKGFNSDLTCTMGRGRLQYRENEWMEEPEANCVRNGFHCCYDPLDCLSYYGDFNKSVYYVVLADGDINEDGYNTKIACTRIKLVKKLSKEEFVAHALYYMAKHPFLEVNGIVEDETARGEAYNGIRIVRGKNPKCAAPLGTVVGMVKEAADSKEITDIMIYTVDGINYLPDVTYFITGEEETP